MRAKLKFKIFLENGQLQIIENCVPLTEVALNRKVHNEMSDDGIMNISNNSSSVSFENTTINATMGINEVQRTAAHRDTNTQINIYYSKTVSTCARIQLTAPMHLITLQAAFST